MRIVIALLALLLMNLTALAADVSKQQAQLEGLAGRIASIESSITDKAADDTGLLKLRIELDSFSKSLIDFGVSLRPRLNEINARLAEIGDPPKEGEPAEPAALTAERTALQEEKAKNNTLLGEAESLSIRASQAVDRIGELRRDLFTNTLLKRTDVEGAISYDVFATFGHELNRARQQLSSRLQFMYSFRTTELLSALALSLLVGLACWFGVRRMFGAIGRGAPDAPEQSYINRLSLAFWSTTVPSLAMAAALALAYALFDYFGIFTPQTAELTEALLVSIAAIFFIQRLVNALLSPQHPERRLIMVSDRAARILVTFLIALAVIHVVDYFIGRSNDVFSAPLNVTVAKSLISSLLISVVLVMIALVKPFDDPASSRAFGWPAWIRIPLLLIAIFIIASAVSGYIGLARFAAAQVVVTGAILATMFIGVQSGQVLAAEGAFPHSAIGSRIKQKFSLSDTALDQLGLVLSFLVYALVFIIGLPLILLQWGFNQLDIQNWLYRILTDIRIGNISISLIGILFGMVVFVVGFLSTRRFQRWLDGTVMARSRVDPGVRNSIRTIVGYTGIALAAIIGLSAAGFDLSSLAIIAGALSLGIGFGLQNIVSNFVSGLILLAERPFKVGDWIVAGNTAGFVRKISVRATEIETFQSQTIILPNSELINSAVGNWHHRNHRGRIEIPVGVAYGVKPRRVHELLLEVASNEPRVLKSPPPTVVFRGFGDSALDFELRCHVPEVLDGLEVATNLRYEIVEAFERENIPIPFPQRDVNLKIEDIEKLAGAIEAARTRKGRAGPAAKS
ncbi:MAG: mechanosensitive ion channel domain-containing protein [Anderseniella sp.]|jgi:small-conductance mechanosensitive channel|nr:mechanosensitive ion channel domain-containing protein [Anderseniella sp.]